MTYRISKDFEFSASHVLYGLPAGHQCGRLHGHNYIVRVVLEADRLDGTGFVRDFGELKATKTFIDDTLDHRHLNDVLPYHPTSERLAEFIYERAVYDLGFVVKEVGVSETPKTWAWYRP